MAKHTPRIFVNNLENLEFELSSSQSVHLISVLRMKEGDECIAFNKSDGEWLCKIIQIKKQSVRAVKINLLRTYKESPKLCLAFCVIKHDEVKLIIEKATELGVTDIYPIISNYTNNQLKESKIENVMIGAAEQSERIDIPILHDSQSLLDFVETLPQNILWISAIERTANTVTFENIEMKGKNCGFIIGPEGGFSSEEKKLLMEKTKSISISQNILRAETAAIACLSVYNFFNV